MPEPEEQEVDRNNWDTSQLIEFLRFHKVPEECIDNLLKEGIHSMLLFSCLEKDDLCDVEIGMPSDLASKMPQAAIIQLLYPKRTKRATERLDRNAPHVVALVKMLKTYNMEQKMIDRILEAGIHSKELLGRCRADILHEEIGLKKSLAMGYICPARIFMKWTNPDNDREHPF